MDTLDQLRYPPDFSRFQITTLRPLHSHAVEMRMRSNELVAEMRALREKARQLREEHQRICAELRTNRGKAANSGLREVYRQAEPREFEYPSAS